MLQNIYVNSMRELAEIPKAAQGRIRTASPAVLDAEVGAESVSTGKNERFIATIFDAMVILSSEVFDIVYENTTERELALSIANTFWRCQRIVYDAALLDEVDFDDPVIVSRIESSSETIEAIFQYRWLHLLSENSNLEVVKVRVEPEEFDYVTPPAANFLLRLRDTRLADITFRICEALSDIGIRFPASRAVYIHSRPDLLKDAAFAFLRHRLWPRTLTSAPQIDTAHPTVDFWPMIEDEVRAGLQPILNAKALEAALREINANIQEEAIVFVGRRADWEAYLNHLLPRPDVIIGTHFSGPEGVALAAAARELEIPLVTLQHGATRELSTRHDANPITFETQIADLHLTFNAQHARISETAVGAIGKSVTVGAPAYYKPRKAQSVMRALSRKKMPEIWYISSGLYIGGRDQLHRMMSDDEVCKFETDLIDHVFAKIERPLLYKPYPTRRYLDPDPVVACAKSVDTIDVVENALDLRHSVHHSRVLITSRSGSTVGYCLSQSIPVVYLLPSQVNLRPEAEAALRRSVFFFDASEPKFHENLVTFLKRPIREIESLWRDLAPEREEFMKQFIAVNLGGAGAKIASELAQLINDSNSREIKDVV